MGVQPLVLQPSDRNSDSGRGTSALDLSSAHTRRIQHLYWRLLMVACLLLVLQISANPYAWLGGLLVTGILLRLIWLGVAFYRLHMLSVPMPLETDQESQNV